MNNLSSHNIWTLFFKYSDYFFRLFMWVYLKILALFLEQCYFEFYLEILLLYLQKILTLILFFFFLDIFVTLH